MASAPLALISLRCTCGQRLRLRNARPGQEIPCPKCGRVLRVPAPSAASAAAPPREAILLDLAELRVAAHGAREGLTGRLAHPHDEALLMTAFAGRPIDVTTTASARPRPGAAESAVISGTSSRGAGGFLDDVLATFYFCGNRGNFVHVLVTALIATAFAIAAEALAIRLWFMVLFNAALWLIVGVIALQFCWSVLRVTVAGADELPLVAPDWDPWDDALRPTLLTLLVTLACAIPAACAYRYVPATMTGHKAVLALAVLIGTLVWPMAVLLAAVSGSLFAVRPDLLVRNIVRVGPAYVVAWLAVVVTLGSWVLTYVYRDRLFGVPVVGTVLMVILQVGLTFYYGYAMFRILGLLYRHYEARLLWR